MPCKRRNNGRSKKNRGRTRPIVCANCFRLTPKDKAIKKFTVKDIIDASSKEDIQAVQTYSEFIIPKVYYKFYYCVSCAIHSRIVRVRSAENRKKRNVRRVVQVAQTGKKEE